MRSNGRALSIGLTLAVALSSGAPAMHGQGGRQTYNGLVTIVGSSARPHDASGVAIWLETPGDSAPSRLDDAARHGRFTITQQNKRFTPHVLVVPVGSSVDFPNLDPFLHNVFSLFDGKRFDLGLYEAGTSRHVDFSRAGVCYVFCNIHPEMSAVILAVNSRYYATSGPTGTFAIADVPPGRYRLNAWHERFVVQRAGELPREIVLPAEATALNGLRLVEAQSVLVPHKNKFGRDYPPPVPDSPIYK